MGLPRYMGVRDPRQESAIENSEFSRSTQLRSVEIFAGVGGLALGVSAAGFVHDAVVEQDEDACETIRINQKKGLTFIKDWKLFEGRVEEFDYSSISEGLDLLCGGPPCQPFSLAGKSLGRTDSRDMFPEAIRAVRELRPRAFLFENVFGLLRPNHFAYAEYVRLQLSCPQVVIGDKESLEQHISRLERCFTGSKILDEKYHVVIHPVNAADYGVPQRRMRVFIVGIRADLEKEWSFPEKSNSREALLYSKFVDGSYWDEHCVEKKRRENVSLSLKRKLEGLKDEQIGRRWRTVRDTISDLCPPTRGKSSDIPNHVFVSGARSYPGHTGSELDLPAKTLKAGVHGVPGGENMLRYVNGKVRYFSVREQARLQTFPDYFEIHGNWTSTTRQLGNAVPVELARVVATSLSTLLSATD